LRVERDQPHRVVVEVEELQHDPDDDNDERR
jgi:hypothetical protein